jgi:hypothetical protein
MAMLLFTMLNGVGFVFLVYVLIQFWKEGHKPIEQVASDQAIEFSLKSKPTVVVVTQPISSSAHAGLCVVSRRAPMSEAEYRHRHRDSANGAEAVFLAMKTARRGSVRK